MTKMKQGRTSVLEGLVVKVLQREGRPLRSREVAGELQVPPRAVGLVIGRLCTRHKVEWAGRGINRESLWALYGCAAARADGAVAGEEE